MSNTRSDLVQDRPTGFKKLINDLDRGIAGTIILIGMMILQRHRTARANRSTSMGTSR
jgi:hypothetical protein